MASIGNQIGVVVENLLQTQALFVQLAEMAWRSLEVYRKGAADLADCHSSGLVQQKIARQRTRLIKWRLRIPACCGWELSNEPNKYEKHNRTNDRRSTYPMNIHLDNLSEEELIDLNHQIVERLRFLQHSRAHQSVLQFRIGERVMFNPDGQAAVTGMLTRYNKKTVTVITDDDHHWNVAPSFLQKAQDKVTGQTESERPSQPATGNVVPLKSKCWAYGETTIFI